MRFSFTPEQEEFRSSLRRALEARSPTKEVRRLMATEAGYDREAWQKLNQELGLTAIHIPEANAEADSFARAQAILLANEMVGGAERLREDALAYVKMRMQFGRSIASFQTTKNKAADMLVDVEMAKSAAYYAAAALDEGDDDLPAVASLVKACAAEAYLQTAIHAVQMHGGIGFTWDNDTHLWFKRAKSSEVLFGDANEHRELMMQHWKH